jgi:hypothetical protein
MNKIIVNCCSCGNPVMQLEEEKEFEVRTRCGNCKADQTIISEKVFQIRIIPIERLSTSRHLTQKVKIVV